jgi:hypothetical protein
MAYVLINRHQQGRQAAIRTYSTYKGALIGMRASNRNSGWTRSSLCYLGRCAMEWGHDAAGDYEYAPYAIMHEFDHKMRHQTVDTVNAAAV